MASRLPLRTLMVLVPCALATSSLLYHAYAGRHGLAVQARLRQELVEIRTRVARLDLEHQTLERDVALLQSDRLDPDLLDEAARGFGFAHPDDLVVLQR